MKFNAKSQEGWTSHVHFKYVELIIIFCCLSSIFQNILWMFGTATNMTNDIIHNIIILFFFIILVVVYNKHSLEFSEIIYLINRIMKLSLSIYFLHKPTIPENIQIYWKFLYMRMPCPCDTTIYASEGVVL